MSTPAFDWDALRAMWVEHADRAASVMADAHPGETFYVLVFMLEDLAGPMLAMQSLEGVGITSEERAGTFDDAPWSPFEWGARDAVDFADPEGTNVRLYRALLDHAKDGNAAHRRALEKQHDEVIVLAAREVSARAVRREGAFARLRMADDFVVFVREHDVRRPFELGRRTIDRPVLERFFGRELEIDRERAAIDALPLGERVHHYLSLFGSSGGPIGSEEAVERLVAIGAPAAMPLAELLANPQHGWRAAKCLADIGAPGADVAVDALLAQLRTSTNAPLRRWLLCALGSLGRLDEVMSAKDLGLDAQMIARGLLRARPRSYRHLAALLDDEATRAATQAALAPGSSRYALRPEDFELAAAYAGSPHAALRGDVALALGDLELGAANVERAVPLLDAMLDDREAEVRRLASLALEWLGPAATSALPHLEKITSDRVEKVADAARRAIAEITWRPAAG
jgi:hypothetical protein